MSRATLTCSPSSDSGTLHANSAQDVPARIEALALAAGLGREAVHSQLGAGVDVVLHLRRGRDGVRRLAEIGVPVRGSDGLVRVLPALTLTDGRLVEGAGAARLAERIG